ncbi:AAA ATPase [Candidatus Sulfopaludibacter sp. SbA4]|nr:AAA ATPase [Candidatus Sulfopaludibacter sp. SbA4]
MSTVNAVLTETRRSEIRPRIPDRIADLGIRPALVNDLILRYLWLHGSASLSALNQTLKLSFLLLENVFHQFRQQQLLEVKGMLGNDYSFTLSNAGRNMATARNEVCQYVGPAPVSIDQYHQVVRSQAAQVRLSRQGLRQAFHDLVLPDGLLDQLGPSLIGNQSLFLYGGTGNGKTSIAERILRIYHDTVLVPYAVEVDGHIITVFDPVVHRPVPCDDDLLDPRWVVCERPCITVGGELSAAMLELRLDESTRVFISPCQMKANNGVLIIDDFGRQVLSPRELLNRWIVPLDRKIDYLTLASGMKFRVPFEMMVVFSTNLDPNDLADEAFLRRIQSKVLVEAVTPDLFDQIFARVMQTHHVPFETTAAECLRDCCLKAGVQCLRACYPMDIYKLVKAISEYEGRPIRMTRANIERAVTLYFARVAPDLAN